MSLSTISFGSLGLTSKRDEFCFDDMTDAELQQELENIADSNLLLRLENDVFERYLARKEPDSLQTIAQLLETAKRMQKIASQYNRTASPIISTRGSLANIYDKDVVSVGSIHSRGSRYVTPSILMDKAPRGGAKISYAYRIEMVNTEIRELQKILKNLEQTSKRKKVYLRAQVEENEISILEICKIKEEFENNVVQKSIKRKIPAEKFIRFVEEWLKATNTAIERVKLKMTSVKSQIRKVRMQLEQRKALGEALRTIDFEQLGIENQDCMQKIEEKNRYLLQMKRIAGHYSIALTRHKGKLDDLMSTMNKVRDQIVSKKLEMKKLRSKQAALKIEIEKEREQLKSMTMLIDEFEVPDVIDFIKMRVELEQLRRMHKLLSRQRKIQQIMLKSNI
ncbi:cilia- and flagella-associated protein 263 [Linepithema humile]|uniref:cilia- and flagella-associated protein 263 n=1 Tax=Linepithema humile TaxID=83485 RepID=UPI00351DCDA4